MEAPDNGLYVQESILQEIKLNPFFLSIDFGELPFRYSLLDNCSHTRTKVYGNFMWRKMYSYEHKA